MLYKPKNVFPGSNTGQISYLQTDLEGNQYYNIAFQILGNENISKEGVVNVKGNSKAYNTAQTFYTISNQNFPSLTIENIAATSSLSSSKRIYRISRSSNIDLDSLETVYDYPRDITETPAGVLVNGPIYSTRAYDYYKHLKFYLNNENAQLGMLGIMGTFPYNQGLRDYVDSFSGGTIWDYYFWGDGKPLSGKQVKDFSSPGYIVEHPFCDGQNLNIDLGHFLFSNIEDGVMGQSLYLTLHLSTHGYGLRQKNSSIEIDKDNKINFSHDISIKSRNLDQSGFSFDKDTQGNTIIKWDGLVDFPAQDRVSRFWGDAHFVFCIDTSEGGKHNLILKSYEINNLSCIKIAFKQEEEIISCFQLQELNTDSLRFDIQLGSSSFLEDGGFTSISINWDKNNIVDANGNSTIINGKIDLENNEYFQKLLKNLGNNRNILMQIGCTSERNSSLITSVWEDVYFLPKTPYVNISTTKLNLFTYRFQGNLMNTNGFEAILNFKWKIYRITDTKKELIYISDKIYSQEVSLIYDNFTEGKYQIELYIEDSFNNIWSNIEELIVESANDTIILPVNINTCEENTSVKLSWEKPLRYTIVDYDNDKNIYSDEPLTNSLLKRTKENISITNMIKDGKLYLTNEYLKDGQGRFNESFQFPFNLQRNTSTDVDSSVVQFILDQTKVKYISLRGSLYLDRSLAPILLNCNTGLISDKYERTAVDLCFTEDEDGTYLPFIRRHFPNSKNFFFQDGPKLKGNTVHKIYLQYDFRKHTYIFAYQDNTVWKSYNLQIDDMPEIYDIEFYGYFNGVTELDYIAIIPESSWNTDTKTPLSGSALSIDDNTKDPGEQILNFTNPENPWGTRNVNLKNKYLGYNLKRQDVLSQKILNLGTYYFSDNSETTNIERQVIDYSIPHNTDIKYLLYPIAENIASNGDASDYPCNPVITKTINCQWDKWCLFTTKGNTKCNLDGSGERYNDKVLQLDKIFFFEMNVETGSITNNTDFSIVKNFTPYPTVQRSFSNYWSGQLKGLLGRIAVNGATFKQTPDMLQEIKELTQNTSRKFLKDRDGNFWEVEISSAVTVDNNDNLDVQLKTKSFNWVEIGDASDIALVSIGHGQDSWLLTELGQEKIDLSRYQWDDNAIWDDSDFWTEGE